VNSRSKLITQSEYARRRGVAKSAVAKAVAEGRISLIEGMIDEEVANIQWEKNTRARADSTRAGAAAAVPPGVTTTSGLLAPGESSARETGQSDSQPNYIDFRARTEKATAESAERKNMREAGQLADTAQIKRGIYDSYRALRDAAMAVSQRAAPKCIGLGDARDIERVISDELRKAFEGWEQRMLDLLPKEDGA
jgi:hypothetical protein